MADCYFINNSNNKRLICQFNPEKVPYERGVNFSSIESPGMCYPLTQYTGGAARTFDVELFYYNKHFYEEDISKARKFFENLMPPERNKKYTKPPTVTFAYGYFVKTCVVTKFKVLDDLLDEDGEPSITHFTVTLRQVSS